MIFNRRINLRSSKLLLMVLSALILSSCSDFLKGKPKKELVLEIKNESMSCLKTVPLDVKKFMKSEATDAEIDKTFNCIDSTLQQFQTRVEGAVDKDSFTADELHQIFEKFIKDAGLSKAATSDLMLLKAAILGGTNQKISKAEISVLREYLLALKVEVKNISPYAKLFTFKKTEVVFSKNMIKNAFAQLNLSLKNLLKISKISQSNYQFSDLKNLATNLKIIGEEQQDRMAVANKMNDLLVGHQEISTEQDRSLYIDSLTAVLRLYAIQVQGHVKLSIIDAAQMNSTFEYIHDVIELLEGTIQYQKSQVISFETIDPLLTEVIKKDILPLKITTDTALSFYKTVLVRVFQSGLSGDVNAFTGIRKVHFVNFKRELAVHRIYSHFIEKIAAQGNTKRVPLKVVQEKLKLFEIKQSRDILHEFDAAAQAQIIAVVNELRTEFLVKTPVIYRFNKIILAVNQEIWDQNWEDLSRGLYNTMMSRQLLLGWGQTPLDKEIKSSYVAEHAMTQWYSEFKKFGIETKIFDPRSKNSGVSKLKEANLFTRAGNGDSQLSFKEAIQFVGILFSGGSRVYGEIAAGLKKDNCNLPEIDVFGNNWNNEACAYENLRKNYKYYFSNLSYLVRYLGQLNKNENDFRSFYDSLLQVARLDAGNSGRLETADLRNLIGLLHYVESLFAAYDADRNGLLSENEIKLSYPKFKTFAEQHALKTAGEKLDSFDSWMGSLAGYACFSRQDLIKESFVFMVYNGKTPSNSDLTILPCLRNQPLIKFKGAVDRKNIINTLKIIKDVLGS